MAAAEVGDPRRRVGPPQPGVDVRHRRQPLRSELVEEHVPVHPGLSLVQVLAEVGVGNAPTAAERAEDVADRRHASDDDLRQGAEVARLTFDTLVRDAPGARAELVAMVRRARSVSAG